jgi:hypothetical protein
MVFNYFVRSHFLTVYRYRPFGLRSPRSHLARVVGSTPSPLESARRSWLRLKTNVRRDCNLGEDPRINERAKARPGWKFEVAFGVLEVFDRLVSTVGVISLGQGY